jgi:acyl-CoA thioesterase-1
MFSLLFETRRLRHMAGRFSRPLLVALAFVTVMFMAAAPVTCLAAERVIVALGASHTFGKGVDRGEDYPAQLENLLSQKGFDVQVINSGVNGQTTGKMLDQLEASVPSNTLIVILQPGGNDKRKGVEDKRAPNIAKIQQRLKSKGITVIMMENPVFRRYPKQADGQHLTPAGYHDLARWILPKVIAALPR